MAEDHRLGEGRGGSGGANRGAKKFSKGMLGKMAKGTMKRRVLRLACPIDLGMYFYMYIYS